MPLKILIIDDDPDDAALAARLLDGVGESIRISSATQFAEILTHARFDAAIVESKVHWSDGLDLIGTLKRRAPGRPVLLFAAAVDPQFLSAALERGLDGFVVKGSRGFAALPEAIRSAQERLDRAADPTGISAHRLLERSATAFFQCTMEGHFVEGNAAFSALLGVHPAAAMDVNVVDSLLPLDQQEATLARLIHEGTVQVPGLAIGPRRAPCTLTATITRDGEEPLITGLLEPLPVATTAAPSATNRSSLLSEKALGTAHDLKEPLRTLEHYSEALRTRYQGRIDSDADEQLGFLHDAAKRMKAQIAKLFQDTDPAFHATPASKPPPTEKPPMANASIAFDRAMANLRASVVASGAQITHGPMPLLPIADDELLQLFQNLIGNAVKFRGETLPRVHISIVETGGEWLVSVEDNGLGIAPEDSARLFTMFGRGKAAEGKPGSGIGLALCRNIVERRGGRIWAAPSAVQGATFFFTLPIGGAAAPRVAPTATRPVRAG